MDFVSSMVNVEGAPARGLGVVGGLQAPSPTELTWVVVVAGLCMVFMAWGIGANDVANSFATAFGARCLTARQACCIAAVCELVGCFLLGGSVSDTIRKGMMSVELYGGDEGRVLVMAGMTSVLLAAATWLIVASKYGMPVSTTHSAVGGVIAFAVASKGYGSVNWAKVEFIIASWFISPTMAGVVGYCCYVLIKKFVLQAENSLRRAKIVSPLLVFIMTLTVAMFTVYKGGKGIGLNKISPFLAVVVSIGISLLVAGASFPLMSRHAELLAAEEQRVADVAAGQDATCELETSEKKSDDGNGQDTNDAGKGLDAIGETEMSEKESDAAKGHDATCEAEMLENSEHTGSEAIVIDVDKAHTPELAKPDSDAAAVDAPSVAHYDPKTEQMFRSLVVVIAAFQSVAHGANDVANSVGPFGAVLAAAEGPLGEKTGIPYWVFLLAGAFIVVGLVMWGVRVMQTVGRDLTEVTPSKACCAQFSATLVVLLATKLGIPISTTHAAVGGVIGVGLADGVNAIDWKVMGKVFFSWMVTLPICALTAAGTYALFLPFVLWK
eukprot:TRINITY_DN10168_c0_g1_i2.p1 TRINITY_DN10168_c0_g1~~TRINITY_DN10168_c0_g1_i2.p1  ORF type:complete len:553 (-),score=91.60 TRINITY_DN10168_c0_g1_i2:426-2084(-)